MLPRHLNNSEVVVAWCVRKDSETRDVVDHMNRRGLPVPTQ